jgi:hypothetical protein
MLVVAALALAGCSSSPSSDASGEAMSSPQRAGDSSAQYNSEAAGKQLAAAAGADQKAPATKVGRERSLVYKGELTVKVGNIDKAANAAGELATNLHGYVAVDKRNRDGDDSSADVTLRIPSKAFRDGVDGAAKLGKELKRDYSTDDITEAVVDIDARIVSQRASVERVRTLLSRADRIADLASVERELAQRESDLASLEAQQRSMAGQVEYSTITVHLLGPTAKVEEKNDDSPTFLSALGAGWDAFTAFVNAILVAFGASLPFLVALGLPLGIAYWLLRRRRANAAPVTGPTPDPTDEPAV